MTYYELYGVKYTQESITAAIEHCQTKYGNFDRINMDAILKEIGVEIPDNNIKTCNAVSCTLCQGPADLLKTAIYQCRKCGAFGDTNVGIFVDLDKPF
jgi:hypothetical protein